MWALPWVPGPVRRPRQELPVGVIAVEDSRQPAAQSRAAGAGAVARAVLAGSCLASRGFGPTWSWRSCCCRPRCGSSSIWSSGRPIFRGGFICAMPCDHWGAIRPKRFAQLAFLPDEAYYSLDAVLRTLTRLTHHATQPASMAHVHGCGTECAGRFGRRAARRCGSRRSWPSGWDTLIARFRPDALAVSIPLLALWLISPLIAWWLSRPLSSRAARFESRRCRLSRGVSPHDVAVL